jgi:hypothetical protein
MPYDLYPAVDAQYNFPPEVRAALAKSLDLRNTVVPLTTVQRNNLVGAELWDGRTILNTTTDRINRYDAGTATWVAIADLSDVDTVNNARAMCQLVLAANTGLTVDVWQTLRNFTEVSDEQNVFDPATGLFTAPAAGLYAFTGHIVFPLGVNNGVRHVALWDAAAPNDAGNVGGAEIGPSRRSVSGETYSFGYHHVVRMTAGLGYKVRVYSADSAAATLRVAGVITQMRFEQVKS